MSRYYDIFKLRYNAIMKNTDMSQDTVERVCLLFSAMSNPVRVRIVELLTRGERTVGDIAEELGIGQSGASQHLAVLSRAGILTSATRGASRLYRVRGPRIGGVLDLIRQFCDVHGLRGVPTASDSRELLEDVENRPSRWGSSSLMSNQAKEVVRRP
jgi:ArsR family transcriptional regulator